MPCLAGLSAAELLALPRTVLEAGCACARRTQGCALVCAAKAVGTTLALALKETKVMPSLRATSVPHLPLALFLHAGGGVGNGFVTGRMPPYSLDAARILKTPRMLGLEPMLSMHSGFNTMFSHPLTGVASTAAKDKRFVDPMHLRVLAQRLGRSPSCWTDLYADLNEIGAFPDAAAAEESPPAGRPFVALERLGREHLPRWLALEMVGEEAASLGAILGALADEQQPSALRSKLRTALALAAVSASERLPTEAEAAVLAELLCWPTSGARAPARALLHQISSLIPRAAAAAPASTSAAALVSAAPSPLAAAFEAASGITLEAAEAACGGGIQHALAPAAISDVLSRALALHVPLVAKTTAERTDLCRAAGGVPERVILQLLQRWRRVAYAAEADGAAASDEGGEVDEDDDDGVPGAGGGGTAGTSALGRGNHASAEAAAKRAAAAKVREWAANQQHAGRLAAWTAAARAEVRSGELGVSKAMGTIAGQPVDVASVRRLLADLRRCCSEVYGNPRKGLSSDDTIPLSQYHKQQNSKAVKVVAKAKPGASAAEAARAAEDCHH